MELPKQPDPSDFINLDDWLRPAYHDALAAWKVVCLAIIEKEGKEDSTQAVNSQLIKDTAQ